MADKSALRSDNPTELAIVTPALFERDNKAIDLELAPIVII